MIMVQDPYGVLADDRINDNIDFSEIHNKEDYKKKVKEYLNNPRGRNLLKNGDYVLDEMYEHSKAKEKVEQNNIKTEDEYKKALRRAQRFHAKRPSRSRRADERITSRRTKIASKRYVRRWIKAKGRSLDVKGVDTRRRFRIAERNKISRLDLRLKNIHVGLDKNSIKHYRDNKGRFCANPYKRR
jgi:hypothetical protein